MNKRKLENDNVTDFSKKIKVEINDYDDISSAELQNEIRKSNSMKLKHYKTLQRKFYEGIHNDAIIKEYFDENIISIYSLEEMNLVCPFCKAYHFNFEYTLEKLFSTCCCKGKIILVDNGYQYPNSIKQLSYNKLFSRLSRIHNNRLALVSFTANFQRLEGKGSKTVRFFLYHIVDSLYPDNEEH